jgi:hypothetical protein
MLQKVSVVCSETNASGESNDGRMNLDNALPQLPKYASAALTSRGSSRRAFFLDERGCHFGSPIAIPPIWDIPQFMQ